MFSFFFFNDTATTEIYTLSLHDALPILQPDHRPGGGRERAAAGRRDLRRRDRRHRGGDHGRHPQVRRRVGDRKSTRLNSSHANISYAVFCLKKKKKYNTRTTNPYI